MNLYFLLILVTLISALFQLPAVQSATFWNADLILSGDWWRIVTGNFTHTNINHLAMNMAALWIMAFLFKPSAKSMMTTLITLSLATGILLMSTDLGNYLGLSGVLHGIFAFYALSEALRGMRSSWLLVASVIMKVVYEQVYGAPQSTAELIGASVAIEAHLIGCISGIVYSSIRSRFLSTVA